MKFLGFAFLFVLAGLLVLGLLFGMAAQLVWYGFLALVVVSAVTFIMGKVRGPRDGGRIGRTRDAERLPR